MPREIPISIPANLSLDDLENSINTKENVDRIKLVDLSKSDNLFQKENIAVFIDQERGIDVPELRLVLVGNRDSIDRITRREAQRGRSLVFHSVVFVQDEENDVAGFR